MLFFEVTVSFGFHMITLIVWKIGEKLVWIILFKKVTSQKKKVPAVTIRCWFYGFIFNTFNTKLLWLWFYVYKVKYSTTKWEKINIILMEVKNKIYLRQIEHKKLKICIFLSILFLILSLTKFKNYIISLFRSLCLITVIDFVYLLPVFVIVSTVIYLSFVIHIFLLILYYFNQTIDEIDRPPHIYWFRSKYWNGLNWSFYGWSSTYEIIDQGFKVHSDLV